MGMLNTAINETSVKKVDVGVDLTKKVEASLKEIVKNIKKVTDLVNEIANAQRPSIHFVFTPFCYRIKYKASNPSAPPKKY